MEAFEYVANPGKVIFGSGSIHKLPVEVKGLGCSKPLLLSTPQQISQANMLGSILKSALLPAVGIYSGATMHTPTRVTDDAVSLTKTSGADCLVSIGGGSTIGLGKAISIRLGLPHICLPTTYAGSEMTPILGETADGTKTTRSDPKILPGIVIYDVDLTMTLPSTLSATSGVNAMAHAGKKS
jgi:alcohol dehydrogenase class IV